MAHMGIYLIAFAIGLIFGSFLNMLIHRLPLGVSLFILLVLNAHTVIIKLSGMKISLLSLTYF